MTPQEIADMELLTKTVNAASWYFKCQQAGCRTATQCEDTAHAKREFLRFQSHARAEGLIR